MRIHLPRTLDEALEIKATDPEAVPLAGGTDLMVLLNFDRLRPAAIVEVSRLPELRAWRRENGHFFLGAGVTYSRIVSSLTEFKPLVEASRTVGSPQIRNRATIGGNLGTASPAGDALPVLAAYDDEGVLIKAGGETRTLPRHHFLVGPKRNARAPARPPCSARPRRHRRPGRAAHPPPGMRFPDSPRSWPGCGSAGSRRCATLRRAA